MADTLPEILEPLFRCEGLELEIIVINDGSTDHVEEVISTYEKRVSDRNQVRFRSQTIKNCGKSIAINRGFEMAEGRYIAIADADDLVDTDELKKMWDCCREDTPDVVIGSFGIQNVGSAATEIRRVHPGISGQNLLRRLAYSPKAPIHLNAVLIRKEFFSGLGGFDESLMRAQDKDLTLRMLLESSDIVICDAVPYLYRRDKADVRENVRKRLIWIRYRQRVLRKNFSGIRLIGAVSSQLIFDLLKLTSELFRINGVRK